jgi:hypothetical protein
MKLTIKISAAILLIVILAAILSINNPLANQEVDSTPISDNELIALIDGLEAGDEALLSISSEGETAVNEAIISRTITGTGKEIAISIPLNLKDGAYRIEIDAAEKYFRSPRGYFFLVVDSKIYNPDSRSVVFDLIPPSARDYEPYRGPFNLPASTGTPTPPSDIKQDGVTLKSEPFRDLSAPKKNPLPTIDVFDSGE